MRWGLLPGGRGRPWPEGGGPPRSKIRARIESGKEPVSLFSEKKPLSFSEPLGDGSARFINPFPWWQMKKRILSIAALTLVATSATAADRMNPADLRRVEKARERLVPAVAKEFGPKARFVHLFGHGRGTLAGVL